MNDFLSLLGINISWGSYLPFANNDLGTTPLLIVCAMCLAGTTIINSYLKFSSLFNTIMNFTGLFAGAYFANMFARSYHIPGIDSMVMIAVAANIGMAVAAMMLLVYYRNSSD
ncbi:MAG: hypothetical protein AAF299_10600 [Pseudomonadota bacterium]